MVQALIVGTITAVGGGTIRDVMIRRIPTVLSSELYAIPALIGAGCAAAAHGLGYDGTLPALGAAVHKLAKVAEDTYISPGYLAQGITYEWCRRGLLPPQIERLKALYLPRLDACLAALDSHMPGAVEARPDGGFFVSLTLPEGVLTSSVRAEAAKRSLNLSDGLAFFPNGGGERFLRLPFCALTPAEIQEGVRRLAESVEASRK